MMSGLSQSPLGRARLLLIALLFASLLGIGMTHATELTNAAGIECSGVEMPDKSGKLDGEKGARHNACHGASAALPTDVAASVPWRVADTLDRAERASPIGDHVPSPNLRPPKS